LGHGEAAMASLRAKEAFDKAAQERRVAEQREVLRQRAAQRAKDRTDERRHGGAFQPKQNINSSGGSRGDGVRGKPKSGGPQGPQRTGASWGLAPTQWTGDVGGELVNLKSEVATLRAQRAKWEAERNAMERQLAKRRAELSEGAPSPPPGSVASPISVRNGEDIDPRRRTRGQRERTQRRVQSHLRLQPPPTTTPTTHPCSPPRKKRSGRGPR